MALLALVGVLLLTGPGASLPATGLVLGGVAALCRAGYVALSRRVGQLFPDWTGLSLALACGACVLTPVSAATGGVAVAAHPAVLLTGLLVALLSSLIPYPLDMAVLRRIDARAFGVLLAPSPAVAAVGFLLLHEQLTKRQLTAIVLVVLAGAWSARRTGRRAAPESRPGTPAG
ncbi:DMT family transporter [Streptomyces sp. NPDC015350]|uniref:EamA family transporter n=1 Tax=Streptomyces sp. NPDC015350 TaxID=3364955 RepID=UPI0036F8531B